MATTGNARLYKPTSIEANDILLEDLIIESGTGNVTINSNSSTTSYSLVLPAAQGASNSLLLNDGTGNLSFTKTDALVDITADRLRTATGTVTISGSVAPSSGHVLVATNSTTAQWKERPIYVAHPLTNAVLLASSTTYADGPYFTWYNTDYSTYDSGNISFEAIIDNRNLDLRLQDLTNNTTLGSLTGISTSGFYSFTVTNPPGNARLSLQAQKSATGGSSPQVIGPTLRYKSKE